MTRHWRAFLLMALVSIMCPFAGAKTKSNPPASNPNAQIFNTIVAQEATQNLMTYLAQTLDNEQDENQTVGFWTGTITSTGWTLSFSGVVNEEEGTTITEVGVLKGKTASWTDTGTVGGTGVTGSGSAAMQSATQVEFNQTAQVGESVPIIVKIIQAILCIVKVPCQTVVMVSNIFFPPNNASAVVNNQLDTSEGTIWGSSVNDGLYQTTAIQTGQIIFSTGSVQYLYSTLLIEGSSDRSGIHSPPIDREFRAVPTM